MGEIGKFLTMHFLQTNPSKRSRLPEIQRDDFLEFEFLPGVESILKAQNAHNMAESLYEAQDFEKCRESFIQGQKHFAASAFWTNDRREIIRLRSLRKGWKFYYWESLV